MSADRTTGSYANTIGNGFKPLLGSIMLEEFTLCKYNRVDFGMVDVITVLNSIIDTNGNSLRDVTLPRKWGQEHRNMPLLSGFYERMNQIKRGQVVKCSCCKEPRLRTNENSCSICCNLMCALCGDFVEEWHPEIVRKCDGCNVNLCRDCGGSRFETVAVCGKCNSVYCALCAKQAGTDLAIWCEVESEFGCVNGPICLDCRVLEDHWGCMGCQSLVFQKLVKDRAELAKENDRLRQEVEELRKQIG